MEENPSTYLWSRVQLAINKKQKCFLPPDYQLTHQLFGFYERAKSEKIKFTTRFVRTIVAIIFR